MPLKENPCMPKFLHKRADSSYLRAGYAMKFPLISQKNHGLVSVLITL
jgi:hypothetical protein